jgi:prephenate dehydratase
VGGPDLLPALRAPAAADVAMTTAGGAAAHSAAAAERPFPHTRWTYRFDAVLIGHPLDDVTRRALAEVRTRVRSLRVFGSYPAAA